MPEYIRLKAEGASEEALASILADNPLPFITGTLCDHVCQEVCCRNDYEGTVDIRAVKLVCAKGASIPAQRAPRNASFKGKVAVLGAGPAGLSCAHHLALAGVPVTVFDEAKEPGGVPSNVIPRFRIPRADVAADIDRIRALGAEFRLGARVDTLEGLRAEGFTTFFICAGAPSPRELAVEGDAIPVTDALSFLSAASRLSSGGDSAEWPYGQPRRVVVAGGGNTAMDAVRVALRLPGIEEVRLSYRRTQEEMPADKEELQSALEEGGKLMELSLPERAFMGSEGPRLSLRVMELGDVDASGRRSPRPTDRTESVDCDLLVAAVGEKPDASLLASLGIPCGPLGLPECDRATQASSRPGVYVGGDAARGPASIITAVADGRRAAYAILRAAGIAPHASTYVPAPPASSDNPFMLNTDKLATRGEFAQSMSRSAEGFVAREAERCLRCDSTCLRCVEVCPNRANFALPIGPAAADGMVQPIQILHVDELCNECGNCGIFCPFEGEPYRGKPTLFADRAAMDARYDAPARVLNAGIAFGAGSQPSLYLRAKRGAEVSTLAFAEWSMAGAAGPMGDSLESSSAIIRTC